MYSAADDSIIELTRKRRAPEDLEDVEELPDDQLAVEARTVDDMSVGEVKTQKKLGHFRVRPYLHHPFHVKPAERYYFLLSNRKNMSLRVSNDLFHHSFQDGNLKLDVVDLQSVFDRFSLRSTPFWRLKLQPRIE